MWFDPTTSRPEGFWTVVLSLKVTLKFLFFFLLNLLNYIVIIIKFYFAKKNILINKISIVQLKHYFPIKENLEKFLN